MAFFRKAGNILRQTMSNHITQEISTSKPSIFQAIRCMSTSKLFIGGLSYSTDDSGLREAFSKYGEVAEARVIVDRESGRSRGFGFVTFSTAEEAGYAMQALDQQELHGRRIRVAHANDRTRGYGGGGGGFRSGGGYGGNYGTDGSYGGSYGGSGDSGYGGNYGGGGGYGGNYGDSAGGGGYSGNYGSGGGGGFRGNYGAGSGGNVQDGFSGPGGYAVSPDGGGNLSGGDGQNFGVAGGGGGSDNLFSGDNVAAGSSSSSGFDMGQFKFDAPEESKTMEGADENYVQDEPTEGNYRDDDDTPDDFANRRS